MTGPDRRPPPDARVAGAALPHESAHLHVSGSARYADDIPLPANALHAALGVSSVAHARIRALDLSAVRAAPGVVCVVTAADVPGVNNCGPILEDDPIFADTLVQCVGQPLFAVAAESVDAARRAARMARVEYEELPAILDIRTALAQQSYVIPSVTLRRGSPDAALPAAAYRLKGSLAIGGQDHFYLEGQIAVALPQEDGCMLVHSSTQHPTEVQHKVADALALRANAVTVQCRRMGGGFGGKESQPALFACVAAVMAVRTGRPVRLRVDRDTDMQSTGKRHDFVADYDVGFGADGRIAALKVMLASRCGYSADLSGPVNDRAVVHVDNAYFLEHVEIVSHRCKTHTVSNTAFRGFGGPQGMMVIEAVIDDIARTLGHDPLDVRRANFYGVTDRNVTHYLQPVEDNVIHTIADQLEASSDYRARRKLIADFNSTSTVIKRGIAMTPVKFGISFNATIYNQAGALVHVYTDGTVLVNHGGTEMGQGLHTKVAQVVAGEFGLPMERVRVSATDTSKVPNT
ncbi:MAG: xanthine dehydrogenase molybdopterin binding subunit, partial [Betaproteobacteria bacterium]|nr:xanthine dehydrogenase molybdopterin binding subunit [Betaproteobacteria bacterium]